MALITGTCHCGAVAFTIPQDTDFSTAARCDCSLCRRRWVPTATVPLDLLNITKGHDALDCYEWNTKTAKHYYCRHCHTYVFHQRRSDPNEYGVNPGCFDEVDTHSLAHSAINDGVNHPSDQQDEK